MFQRHSPTREQTVCVLERERLWQFNHGVFPQFANWRKANARRKTRRDHNNPFVSEAPHEADATFREYSARTKRQIFAAPEEVGMLPAKAQHLLGQKQFHSAI